MPYYDPDSRPVVPSSIEAPDDSPIPEDELPNDAPADHKPVHESNIDQSVCADTSVALEDSETYNIERVIKERKRKRKKQFLVKWEGYGPYNSWVDETDIVHLDLHPNNN